MNTNALRALGRDALYQVFDNWVFRILFVLGSALVLFTFLIGFRENEIVLLFGVKSWSYETLLALFGFTGQVEDPQGIVITALVTTIRDWIAGALGIMTCVAATAFFVPDLIQKGAADVVFHKPLGRFTFYIARYFSGLLMVGILATAMSIGLYAGFALVSQYHDPAILIGAITITYVFGLVYAFSMLVGVITRSTVAAILLTIVFFLFNGCVHGVWGSFQEQKFAELEGLQALEDEEATTPEQREGDAFATFVENVNAPLHFVLPKTGDADVIAKKLRRAVSGAFFTEEGSLVTLFELPAGTQQISNPELNLSPELSEVLGEMRLALRTTEPDESVTYVIFRRPNGTREVERRRGTEIVADSVSRSAAKLIDAIELDPSAGKVDRELESFGSHRRARSATASASSWTQTVDGAEQSRKAVVFRGAEGKLLYTVWIHDTSTPPNAARDAENLARIDDVMGFDLRGTSYEENFTLDAPWRMNILFSIGSSLAFVLVMLLLGWWRLARIEF